MSSVAQLEAEIPTRRGLFLIKKKRNPVLKKIYDRQSFKKLFYPIYIDHEDSFGLLMSSVAQLEVEIAIGS